MDKTGCCFQRNGEKNSCEGFLIFSMERGEDEKYLDCRRGYGSAPKGNKTGHMSFCASSFQKGKRKRYGAMRNVKG